MNSTEKSAAGEMESSPASALGPSKTSDMASIGSGGTRLPQTTKANMSMRPARLVTILESPQQNAAASVITKGTNVAAPRCSLPMARRPKRAMAAPPTCTGNGRSPRKKTELQHADGKAIGDENAPGDIRLAHEEHGRQGAAKIAQRCQEEGRHLGDAPFDGNEVKAPDDDDEEGKKEIAQGHGVTSGTPRLYAQTRGGSRGLVEWAFGAVVSLPLPLGEKWLGRRPSR